MSCLQVKTHLQSQAAASIAVGHQYKHQVNKQCVKRFALVSAVATDSSSRQGMNHALAAIYREHGVTGLWRGSSAAVARVSVGSAAQLSTFSSSKELVADLQVRLVLLSHLCSVVGVEEWQ